MTTHILKRKYGTLRAGTKLSIHYRWKGNVIGIPRDPDNWWTPEFVAKHPEIFEKL